jgi:hypothetical protein
LGVLVLSFDKTFTKLAQAIEAAWAGKEKRRQHDPTYPQVAKV